MSYGILVFLDDIAALTKMASASLDDIAAQSLKASTKSLGIVIDDAAVSPKYVTSVSPKRELPAILRIAKWSLFNKIVVITPAAILLSAYAPWIITPVLMLGGLYLDFRRRGETPRDDGRDLAPRAIRDKRFPEPGNDRERYRKIGHPNGFHPIV